jgi:hypothetical protein
MLARDGCSTDSPTPVHADEEAGSKPTGCTIGVHRRHGHE